MAYNIEWGKWYLFGAPRNTFLDVVEVPLEIFERRVHVVGELHNVDETTLDVLAVKLDDRCGQVVVVFNIKVCEADDNHDLALISLRSCVEYRLDRVEDVHVTSRTLGGRDADRQETCRESTIQYNTIQCRRPSQLHVTIMRSKYPSRFMENTHKQKTRSYYNDKTTIEHGLLYRGPTAVKINNKMFRSNTLALDILCGKSADFGKTLHGKNDGQRPEFITNRTAASMYFIMTRNPEYINISKGINYAFHTW